MPTGNPNNARFSASLKNAAPLTRRHTSDRSAAKAGTWSKSGRSTQFCPPKRANHSDSCATTRVANGNTVNR
jgi:hypothetical protein